MKCYTKILHVLQPILWMQIHRVGSLFLIIHVSKELITVGNFILGVLIPLPCDDPLDDIEQIMKQQKHGRYTIEGYEILALQWSKHVDATPYAYISPDGCWHEHAECLYPEEVERSQQIHRIATEHIAQHGFSNLEQLRQRMEEVPEPVTDWHRTWQSVTKERMCIVAFVWCHF